MLSWVAKEALDSILCVGKNELYVLLPLGGFPMLIYLQLIDDPEEQSRFERLYTTYRSLMFHKANEILGNTQDAEDAVHEAFLAIAKNFDRVSTSDHRETASFTVKIVTNKAIDIYRRKKKHPTTEYTDALSGETVELEADDDIARVLLKLPVRYRNFILLKYEKGYSNSDLSKLLQLTPAGVRKLDQRAKMMLEKICKEEGLL
jgi:RNA polymerase sigma-70 factor (ECF subfamily)